MQTFIVLSVARQIEGDYIFIRTEGGYTGPDGASKAQTHIQKLKSQYVNLDGSPKVTSIKTPQGEASCIYEIGMFEVEVEQ